MNSGNAAASARHDRDLGVAGAAAPPETIGQYLRRLERRLQGQDPALVQDALYDAEEFLRASLGDLDPEEPADSMPEVIESFGSPEEVAESYLDADMRLPAGLAGALAQPGRRPAGLVARFFGVVLDPMAYSSLLFSLAGLISGILYFTWVAFGTALSLGLSILIIGLPVALLFLASLRGLSLIEGRMVEALLGVRMPRRPRRAALPTQLVERVLYWIRDSRTWSTFVYLWLRLPIGVLTFGLFTVLLALTAGFLSTPVLQFMGMPTMTFGDWEFFWPEWLLWVPVLAGGLGFVITLHLAKLAGRAQGGLAKAMLVGRR